MFRVKMYVKDGTITAHTKDHTVTIFEDSN